MNFPEGFKREWKKIPAKLNNSLMNLLRYHLF
jgi:hypothetical protein